MCSAPLQAAPAPVSRRLGSACYGLSLFLWEVMAKLLQSLVRADECSSLSFILISPGWYQFFTVSANWIFRREAFSTSQVYQIAGEREGAQVARVFSCAMCFWFAHGKENAFLPPELIQIKNILKHEEFQRSFRKKRTRTHYGIAQYACKIKQ